MKEPPQNVSATVRKLNPHLYAIYQEKVAKLGQGYVTEFCGPPPPHAKATQSDSVATEGIKTPKTPEDRLNKTEREFLSRLRNDVYGHMQHIGIQSLTLQLGFDCRYTPDFWTRMEMGDFRLWEVKGFMRDDARVKLYAAARAFPFWTFVLVQKVKGEWQERIIEQ